MNHFMLSRAICQIIHEPKSSLCKAARGITRQLIPMREAVAKIVPTKSLPKSEIVPKVLRKWH